MKKYAATKPSGVEWLGDVPAHWEVKRLKFVADVHSGIAKGKKYLPNQELVEVPYLRVANVQDGYLNLDDISTISVTPAEAESYQLCPLDILMNEGGDNDKLGRGTVWEGQITPCIHQNHVFAIRHNGTVDSWFLSYFFGSSACKPYFFLSGNQATNLASISSSAIADTPFPAPPLSEQRAIAAFLDERTAHLDGLIRRKEDLLKLLAEQRAALITRAVTRGLDATAPLRDSGVPWLGQVPAHWEVMPLKRDIELVTSGSRGWAEFYANEGQLFIRIGNLTRNSIEFDLSDIQYVAVPDGAEAERSSVRGGDIVVSITAYLGSVAVVPESLDKAYVSQHVALVRPTHNRILSKWIGYYILSEVGKTYLQMQAYGGTKIQLSLDDVRTMPIIVPPLAEQETLLAHIEKYVSRNDQMTDITNREIAKLREYRAALITAAVTGRIDVRAAVVPTPEPALADAL